MQTYVRNYKLALLITSFHMQMLILVLAQFSLTEEKLY